ncbi:glycosyltransferase [Fundidesulfovibrio terrae]|uniref:glycosyltransferase n=1 Tax=Fundidesulfovibrio terrae TaxID=2922866 RepID=UPI001FAFF443|nr:glycosyltransferase [Fundidesulfovibrio terrae]
MPDPPGVHHHVLLERRGGAAGVARTLARMQASERSVSLSFEAAEPGGAEPGGLESFLCPPDRLAGCAPAGRIVHVHATKDWGGLLSGFLSVPRPLVVTAHDCALITGGCVYPASCPKHELGCPDPCPRDYPDTKRTRAERHALVRDVRPAMVSPSSWLAGLLRREWPDLAVKVVPNGVVVPPELMEKASARAKLGIAPEARVALFLAHGGTRAGYKGGGRYEALFARIAALVPGALGVVAGGEAAERHGGMLFLPYLEGEMLSVVLCASDVLVYPSLADNHPLIVLEAMAHGLPVASYAVGGIVEQVLDAVTGRLAFPMDEDGLVSAASALLTDHSLARAMGENGRQRALRHFTAERMAADYAKVYARLVAVPGGSSPDQGQMG